MDLEQHTTKRSHKDSMTFRIYLATELLHIVLSTCTWVLFYSYIFAAFKVSTSQMLGRMLSLASCLVVGNMAFVDAVPFVHHPIHYPPKRIPQNPPVPPSQPPSLHRITTQPPPFFSHPSPFNPSHRTNLFHDLSTYTVWVFSVGALER